MCEGKEVLDPVRVAAEAARDVRLNLSFLVSLRSILQQAWLPSEIRDGDAAADTHRTIH
jgi:hypothetical protein